MDSLREAISPGSGLQWLSSTFLTSRSCPASPKNTSFSVDSCSLNAPYVLCLNFFSGFLLFLLITSSPLMASMVIQNTSPPCLLRLWMFQVHVSELFQKPIYYVFPNIVCISHIYIHVIYTYIILSMYPNIHSYSSVFPSTFKIVSSQ